MQSNWSMVILKLHACLKRPVSSYVSKLNYSVMFCEFQSKFAIFFLTLANFLEVKNGPRLYSPGFVPCVLCCNGLLRYTSHQL